MRSRPENPSMSDASLVELRQIREAIAGAVVWGLLVGVGVEVSQPSLHSSWWIRNTVKIIQITTMFLIVTTAPVTARGDSDDERIETRFINPASC